MKKSKEEMIIELKKYIEVREEVINYLRGWKDKFYNSEQKGERLLYYHPSIEKEIRGDSIKPTPEKILNFETIVLTIALIFIAFLISRK